jgi:hypothetical protein
MLIRIFSPTECGLIRDADLKKCGLNRMTTVIIIGKQVRNAGDYYASREDTWLLLGT